MKSVAGFFVMGALAGIFVLRASSGRQTDARYSSKPEVMVSSVQQRTFAAQSAGAPLVIRTKTLEELEIQPTSSMVRDFKFDSNENVYFISTDMNASNPRESVSRIIRVDRVTRSQRVLWVEEPDQMVLQCYDIDDSGGVFVASSRRNSPLKHVSILSPEGNLISTIDLVNFRPYAIAVDRVGNIWLAGDTPDQSSTNNKGEIRIYDRSGTLIATPLGGFTSESVDRGHFVENKENMLFMVEGATGIVYNFEGTRVRDAWSYPRQEANTPSSQRERRFSGLAICNGYAIWSGTTPPSDSQYSFVMLTSPTGDVAMPENSLTTKSGQRVVLVGADRKDHLYFLGIDGHRPILKKSKLVVKKAKAKLRGDGLVLVNDM
jgi:hypothetical protein